MGQRSVSAHERLQYYRSQRYSRDLALQMLEESRWWSDDARAKAVDVLLAWNAPIEDLLTDVPENVRFVAVYLFLPRRPTLLGKATRALLRQDKSGRYARQLAEVAYQNPQCVTTRVIHDISTLVIRQKPDSATFQCLTLLGKMAKHREHRLAVIYALEAIAKQGQTETVRLAASMLAEVIQEL